MKRSIIIAAGMLLLVPSGLTAAASRSVATAQPIYAAFAVAAPRRPQPQRCGVYEIFRATYTGNSTSPDARLAGSIVLTGRIVVNASGTTGIANGTIVIRDARRIVRFRGTMRGVLTERSTVNGLVTGTVFRPTALLLANVTIVFDEVLRFGFVQFGLESGRNSAVAYPTVPRRCR
jgi:hypothetical protein